MTFQISMTEIMSTLAQKGVDFQVLHGKDGQGRVRSSLVAATVPAVRVDFGDAKHGHWITRIHEVDNHANMFGSEWVDALFEMEPSVTRAWTSGSNENKMKFFI